MCQVEKFEIPKAAEMCWNVEASMTVWWYSYPCEKYESQFLMIVLNKWKTTNHLLKQDFSCHGGTGISRMGPGGQLWDTYRLIISGNGLARIHLEHLTDLTSIQHGFWTRENPIPDTSNLKCVFIKLGAKATRLPFPDGKPHGAFWARSVLSATKGIWQKLHATNSV